jgi:hypothetical protein
MADNTFAKRLARIREQIHQAAARTGREAGAVRLIGASKKKSAEDIAHGISQGLEDFGENYFQEWRDKQNELRQSLGGAADRITWHFIGHLQGNKVHSLVGAVEWIHTVDSLKLAKKISQAAAATACTQKILLEVNLASEPSKSGFSPEALAAALPDLAFLPHLSIRGLMAVPPESEDPERVRPWFRRLKSLLDESNQTGVFTEPLTELSMGMSQDFEVAIEEGATMVRIGTALFGARG